MIHLPLLSQLCPYCAAFPQLPCNDAMQGHLLGLVHATDRDWADLYRLDCLTRGLRQWAESLAGPLPPGPNDPLCGDPTCRSRGCTQAAIDEWVAHQEANARLIFVP